MKMNLHAPLVDVRPIADLRDMLYGSVAAYGERTAFLSKIEKGKPYVPISYQQYGEDVKACGSALLKRGFGQNARVAILAESRYEWYVSYLAIVGGEAVVVPLDKELPVPEMLTMMKQAEVSCVFFSQTYANKVYEMNVDLPQLKMLISYDEEALCDDIRSDQTSISFSDLQKEGQAELAAGYDAFMTHTIDPEEMRILLFTSGTTAQAKAVMHNHRSICANLMGMSSFVEITPNDVFLSLLPLHHTYECTCGFLCPIYRGAAIAQCEGLRYITKNLEEAKVTVLLAVPLILEAFHRNIWKNINANPKTSKTLRRMVKVCKVLRKAGLDLNAKIFSKIHDSLGGHLRLLIAGGAAIEPQVLEDFDHWGFVAFQGYGLTECGPILALNRVEARKNHSAGLPLPGVDVKIIDQDENGIGEIIGKGPNIMMGYWNDPEANAEVLIDGYFHTGDLGYLDEDGFVIISGRKKNVIVTKNGKNIFPEELEFALCRSPYVTEALVSGVDDGDGDYDIVAEIFPNFDEIKAALGANMDAEQLQKLMEQAVKESNESVVNYKRIRRFTIRDSEFAKTTSKKIRRSYADSTVMKD